MYRKSQKRSLFTQKKLLSSIVATIVSASLAAPVMAKSINAYIGTYAPHGEGVYLAQIDSDNGAMTEPQLAAKVTNGAQLIYNQEKKVLYVASEISNYKKSNNGAIIAYSVADNGDLTEINQVNSQGAGPVYLSLHPTRQFLFIANYVSGSVAVFPINKDGGLADAISVKQGEGKPGLAYPAAAVKGSFAISDHNGSHAHTINPDSSGRFAFSTDLGLDKIYQWKVTEQGMLEQNNPPFIMASSEGAGPRHFVFHPSLNMIYLINEESSTLTSYKFDPTLGTLEEKNTLSSLPTNYQGTSYASGIILTQDGKHLYIANRLHNSISQFDIDAKGDFKLVDNIWTRGDYTRTIVFSPDEKFIYAMNQRSDNIARFAVNEKNGRLSFVDDYIPVGSPSQMVFAE